MNHLINMIKAPNNTYNNYGNEIHIVSDDQYVFHSHNCYISINLTLLS